MAICPTGPAPNTATVSPVRISASLAPNQAVGKMSETMMAWASDTPGGTGTRLLFAYGIRAYSACRPSKAPAASGPPKKAVPASLPPGLALSHWAWYPARQYEQYPQEMVDGMTTRSPTEKLRTPVPT